MYCPNCGKEIPENVSFCGYCGTKIIETEQPAPVQPKQWQDHVKHTLTKINVADFKVFLQILKNPIEKHEMSVLPMICVYVLLFISNIWLVHHFLNGVLLSLLVVGGSFLIHLLNDYKEFHFSEACSETAEILLLPTLLAFISAIFFQVAFSKLSTLYMNMNAYAEIYQYMEIAVVILLIAGFSLFTITTRKYTKIHVYLLLLIYSVEMYVIVQFTSNIFSQALTNLWR